MLVDTREQQPLHLPTFQSETATLPVGDYGIKGFSDWANPSFVVERKSAGDLVSSLTHERERFFREIEKLRAFQFAALVIEAHEADIAAGNYRSDAAPEAILQSLTAIQVRTGVHVLWAGDATGAALALERLVRQFIRGRAKEVAVLAASASRGQTEADARERKRGFDDR